MKTKAVKYIGVTIVVLSIVGILVYNEEVDNLLK